MASSAELTFNWGRGQSEDEPFVRSQRPGRRVGTRGVVCSLPRGAAGMGWARIGQSPDEGKFVQSAGDRPTC